MARPSSKSPIVEKFLEDAFSRTTSIKSDVCVSCGNSAALFKDELSVREYTISGLCQNCQDSVFGNS